MYKFTTSAAIRKELVGYKKQPGIYIITAGTTKYVGQAGDLYKRLSAHIGNMDQNNNPKLKGAALKMRNASRKHKGYSIEVFVVEEWYLNFYEDLAVALKGGVSKSKKDRKGRAGIPETLERTFTIATEGQFELFKKRYKGREFW